MARTIRLREILFGVEGVAVLRHMFDERSEAVDDRVAEIRRFAADADSELLTLGREFPERPVEQGYSEWADTYDGTPNALIEAEQPVVERLLESIPVGRALDAACGTGRITERLANLGHEVVGIDCTPAMLTIAQEKIPAAEFHDGHITDLPFPDEDFDLITCALALGHERDLTPPVGELARVLRPGGRLVITDVHPFALVLGGQAGYSTADGQWGFVRNHLHFHSSYLNAFQVAGLMVRSCNEPPHTENTVRTLPWFDAAPEATREALVDLPLAIIWDLEHPQASR